MKAIIKDKATNEYYCVPEIVGVNTFPFWSEDINDAAKFESRILAVHETEFNDFTDRKIEILDYN